MKPVALALLALVLPATAVAALPPLLFPGDVASVTGTRIVCTSSSGDTVRCVNAAGLAATLSKPGAVRVTKGASVLLTRTPAASSGKHLRVGLNNGFGIPNAPVYCHVFLQGEFRTITCSEDEPAGVPNTYGFNMTDRTVQIGRAHV